MSVSARQADRRQTTDYRQTDGRATAYSERERDFTLAKNFMEIVPGEPLRQGNYTQELVAFKRVNFVSGEKTLNVQMDDFGG